MALSNSDKQLEGIFGHLMYTDLLPQTQMTMITQTFGTVGASGMLQCVLLLMPASSSQPP